MKVLNENNVNRYTKAIKNFENFLRKRNMTIGGNNLIITIGNKEFTTNDSCDSFPRLMEDEVLILKED